MRTTPRGGVLVVSIDLDWTGGTINFTRRRAIDALRNRLVELFDTHQIAATWAVSDPSHAANYGVMEQLVARGKGHEIGLLGDRTWAGSDSFVSPETAEVMVNDGGQRGRGRFARHLSRMVFSAQAAGLRVSSLVLRDSELNDHFDLAVKYGITALRGGTPATGRSTNQPKARRFGLWEVPATVAVRARRGWLGWEAHKIRRAILRAAESSSVCHLRIDGPAWCEHPHGQHEYLLASILRYAARLRSGGRLSVETMSDCSARLSRPRHQARPARSILRAA